ncbi:protein of unknown function [Magnetospirillum sp. XM-1]|nr:protein of unknown function [Magnetospirillum sp. XM-1]
MFGSLRRNSSGERENFRKPVMHASEIGMRFGGFRPDKVVAETEDHMASSFRLLPINTTLANGS